MGLKETKNKGFSLVELIIVIAIMAILVAVMVPVLLRYIEKTKVSSDTQLADTVRGAFLCAITDAKVLSDPDSTPFINQLETTGMNADDNNFRTTPSVMRDSVEEILGTSLSSLNQNIKSAHDPGARFFVQTAGGNVIVTILYTDRNGKKDKSTNTPNNDIVVD